MLDHFRKLMASLIDRVPERVEADMHGLIQNLEARFQALEVKVGLRGPAPTPIPVPPAVEAPAPISAEHVNEPPTPSS